jgi:hypothetical protein
MVIKIIKIKSILPFKSENYTPVFFNSKTPVTLPFSFKWMNFPAFKKLKILRYPLNTVDNFKYLFDFVHLIKR